RVQTAVHRRTALTRVEVCRPSQAFRGVGTLGPGFPRSWCSPVLVYPLVPSPATPNCRGLRHKTEARMVWGWLWPWRRKHTALPPLEVVMYTRRGCHLCEDAWQHLTDARRRHGFSLSQVDVDGDPALAARYGLEVPVVTVDGRVRFRGG